MRRLLLVCVMVLVACAPTATPTLSPSPTTARLTTDLVVQEFKSKGLRAAPSDAPPPATTPQPARRSLIGTGVGAGFFLYEFVDDANTLAFVEKMNGGRSYVFYAHRNIALACNVGGEVECYPYFSVLLAMR